MCCAPNLQVCAKTSAIFMFFCAFSQSFRSIFLEFSALLKHFGEKRRLGQQKHTPRAPISAAFVHSWSKKRPNHGPDPRNHRAICTYVCTVASVAFALLSAVLTHCRACEQCLQPICQMCRALLSLWLIRPCRTARTARWFAAFQTKPRHMTSQRNDAASVSC